MLLGPLGTRVALAQSQSRPTGRGQGQPSARSSDPEVVADKIPAAVAEPYRQAIDAEKRGNWSGAAQLYEDVLKKFPNLEPARLRYGTVLVLQGRAAEGYKILDSLLGPNPPPEDLAGLALLIEGNGERTTLVGGSWSKRYWEGALKKAEAMDYARAQNPAKLSLLARAALEVGKDEPFRAATAKLLSDYPAMMETHYFSAIRAMKDRDWVTAEDEIHAAGRMGLPQAVVDSFLASGLHSRASTWRYLYDALYAAIAWVVGLGVLFVSGKLLSAATLRSAQAGDPNRAITPMQRGLRKLYRAVISLAAAYYYISLPFVALLAIAAMVGFGYGVLMLPRIPGKLLVLVLVFGLAMLTTIWASIRSLFVRVKFEDPGRPSTIDEAPRLWALTREVAAQVGTRPVDAILLTPGTEVAVFERGRWLDKVRDRARRSLILGLGVVEGFRIDPFRAVLAHEYGHFLHRDTAGGDVALRVNATMGRFAMAMLERGNAQWWNIGWQFVRLYHLLFRRITHGASRLQEINADRVAARAFGKEAFEEGLRHVIRRDVALRYQQAIAQNELPGGEAATFESETNSRLSHIRAEVRRQVEVDVAQLWDAKTSEDDTHPCPADRIQLIARLATTPASRNGGNGRADHDGQESPSGAGIEAEPDVEHLFADPARIRAERDELRAKELQDHADAKRSYCVNLIDQITAYMAQNPGLSDTVRERGNVRMELRDYKGAVADYSEAIRLDGPHKALSYYGRGLARSKLADLTAAADDLRQAMTLDRSLEQDQAEGRAELAQILLRLGDPAAAIVEYDKAIERDPNRLSLYLRRALAHTAAGDDARAEADYTRALELDSRCAEALAGRAHVRAAMGRHDEAEADTHRAISIEPELATL